ncbi:MAG: hypothetical protein J6386_07825 [Candidatus Synoicihabitans palmerolidicus]|nr:hypothetical protein [Candidatus Synoicihabitans palmerolidicus]
MQFRMIVLPGSQVSRRNLPAVLLKSPLRAWWLELERIEMNYPHFVRIDQETGDGELEHYVVHTHDPKLAVQFSAETVNGKAKPGTIKRISVPNSWAGEYAQYGKLVAKAEAFFKASFSSEEEGGGRLGIVPKAR